MEMARFVHGQTARFEQAGRIVRAQPRPATRLADRQQIRFESMGGGVSARTGADGMRLVDDQQRSVLAGELAEPARDATA